MHYIAFMDADSMLKNLGMTVRGLREARSWTRRELARRSGVSERFLAEIESGRGNPSLLRILDLATSLNTTPGGLLGAPTVAAEVRQVVALLGLRGAGKSTVGAALASALGWEFVELDDRVEQLAGLSLGEMFELHGQDYYRRQERQALDGLFGGGAPLVLATGGGLVTETATFDRLREGAFTIWLRARPEDHWERVIAQGDMRPMEGNDEAFAHLRAILAERERLYAQAEWTFDTSSKTEGAVIDAVTERVRSELHLEL